MNIGFGYDVHPLIEGGTLILGGTQIPFHKGLKGHSDADVLTHAIMDALLGAAGLHDIGKHFPSTDPTYKNISSLILLQEVNRLIREKGFKINNIDSTIVAEQPKLLPFIDKMRNNLSTTLEISMDQIMIKATTTDGLGFIGEKLGIAAFAIASVTDINILNWHK